MDVASELGSLSNDAADERTTPCKKRICILAAKFEQLCKSVRYANGVHFKTEIGLDVVSQVP